MFSSLVFVSEIGISDGCVKIHTCSFFVGNLEDLDLIKLFWRILVSDESESSFSEETNTSDENIIGKLIRSFAFK